MGKPTIEDFFTDGKPVAVDSEVEESICKAMDEFECQRSIRDGEAIVKSKEIIII